MKYIRIDTSKVPNKKKEVTKEELIFLLGENRFNELLKDVYNVRCETWIEVNPTPYGTSNDWVGIAW